MEWNDQKRILIWSDKLNILLNIKAKLHTVYPKGSSEILIHQYHSSSMREHYHD